MTSSAPLLQFVENCAKLVAIRRENIDLVEEVVGVMLEMSGKVDECLKGVNENRLRRPKKNEIKIIVGLIMNSLDRLIGPETEPEIDVSESEPESSCE